MGNATNEKQWAAMERLRFVEKSAFWRGSVNRQDLMTTFGLSSAQATSDLQKFQEMSPKALIYNLNRKRYEGAPDMRCVLHEPSLEEAVALFLGLGSAPSKTLTPTEAAGNPGPVAWVTLPKRTASAAVLRAVFQAVLHGLRLRVKYQTMSGKPVAWRWIMPHALGHDGYRWHVRCWSESGEHWADFVLSRILEAEWPTEKAVLPETDVDWETWEELTFAPHPNLSADQRETIAADYGMEGGSLTLRVRRAMVDYTLAHLRLPMRSGNLEAAKVIEIKH